MDNYQPQVLWQGKPVGVFDNPRPDMAYLEGLWLPDDTAAAAAFKSLAGQLDLHAVLQDLSLGVEILLQHEGRTTRAVIISLTSENELLVRRITDR